MKIKSINPYNNEINKEFELLNSNEVDSIIKKSKNIFNEWKNKTIEERLNLLKKVAINLRDNKEKYAEIITKEIGKPIKESISEIEKCAWVCDYYFENAEEILSDKIIKTEAKESYVVFEPLGVIFAIMPWNYPFWQVFRFAIPTIASGNVALLKHASNVPISALTIEKIFIESGIPKNVFNTLLIDSEEAMRIIKDVDGVALTGSYNAGSSIGSLAGRYIKPIVLELGGSDPFIVLEDADVDKAAKSAVQARFLNAGQSCISSKRFIIMEKIADEFISKFKEIFMKLKIGDPLNEETDIGPLASQKFVNEMENQLKEIDKDNYEQLTTPTNGCFFPPTFIKNADLNSKVWKEEVFGPIAPIIRVNSEEEAIKIANNSEFGLGSSIWTKDLNKAKKLAKKIEAGTVSINDFTKSDPRLPFGGIKTSGIGRELSSFGIKEFVNIKTVVIRE